MNSHNAYYLTHNTGVSNMELENIISQDLHHSYYANSILKGRFELGEKAISKDCVCSFRYAKNVLKGRFKLGEKRIVKNFRYYFEYLVKVMGYNHE